MELLVAAFTLAILVLLWPGMRRSIARDRQRVLAEGAQRIKRQIDAVYGGVHEYVEVDLADFDWLDHDFYLEVTRDLEAAKFSLCADVEDLTLTRAQPKLRTCLRTMLGDGGLIRAGFAHLRPQGSMRLLQLFGLIPRNTKVIELVSELQPGWFLSTSNTKGIDHMSYPEAFRMERHPAETSAKELVRRHRERLAKVMRDQGGQANLVYFRSYDDAIASAQRGHVILSRHREKLGGLTREELERIVDRPLKKRELGLINRRARANASAPELEQERLPELERGKLEAGDRTADDHQDLDQGQGHDPDQKKP